MEILKRTFIAAFLILLVFKLQAQTNSVLQKAFRNSYANEQNKNYVAAISDIAPYYSDNNYELNIRLGWLHYLSKNYTSSQSYYQKAIGLKPGSIEAKFGYIKPLSFLQSWDKVIEQYLAILKIDPQNTQANYWAGVIYYNRKQYDAAIRCFKVVIALYPFDYDGNHMLAWSDLMAGRKADAKPLFERALIIKPSDASSLDGLNRCN
ncbi:tetratricopeptide repeat protein [Mucilaginibacter sp. FT3.2]|uniref:tetratricopeptide repeat protein n=1 Tax=Mucilaginibacter sp. FT3.2 TaxID=2723090 RepID=UPI00162234A6|nr:tetratricopeptide repeat protein [Mucilaginibacter sp. FT3.2]MBB6231594.1 tetratricopeptide (TPR) repeat protein [Mucilaginibacter sp. FT3.2]